MEQALGQEVEGLKWGQKYLGEALAKQHCLWARYSIPFLKVVGSPLYCGPDGPFRR